MRILLVSALLLTVMLPLPAGAEATALRITEILPDPADGAREFIELHNTGNSTIDLQGYAVEDAAGNRFTFDAWSLAPGGRVVVWGGGASDSLGPAWSRATVWNNGGDTALLLDPGGVSVDTMTYGDAAVPAPATGQSLAWIDGAWQEADPTPAAAPEAESGQATVTVANAAPEPTLQVPARVRPGASLEATILVGDPNGDDDLASWYISADGAVLAQGEGAPGPVTVDAPGVRGPWRPSLTVTDQAGASGQDEVTVQVRDKDLYVALPENRSLPFPALMPGARHVDSQPFSVHNDGDQTMEPVIDFSPFSAPGGQIPVDGNLRVAVTAAGSSVQQWFDYDGPMTQLPAIPPGGHLELVVQIQDIPVPLPAGQYGTTFTVTP